MGGDTQCLLFQIDKTLIFVFILVLLISVSNMNVPNHPFWSCGDGSVGKPIARPSFDSGSYITAQSNIAHL